MASNNLLAVLAVVAVVLPTVTMATEHWVGGDSGWTTNYNYSAWAKNQVFLVGDTLVFNYTKGNHNVFKVNGTEFANCSIPPVNQALTSGHDVVQLATPGKKWYICGVGEHCSALNQKLVINVEGTAPAPAPSSAFGITASGYHALVAAAGVVVIAIIAVV